MKHEINCNISEKLSDVCSCGATPVSFSQLSGAAKEVLGQLFMNGPQWDGNVVSKSGRDELRDHELIERGDGWQWLSRAGVKLASDYKQIPASWFDGRWRKKAIT